MPARWPSLRGQKTKTKRTTIGSPHQFEFDFSAEPSVFDAADLVRPTTSTDTQAQSDNKNRGLHRPRSSAGLREVADKRLQLVRTEDKWIGVAFGSPDHPPFDFPAFIEQDDSVRENIFLPSQTTADQNTSSGKWRKIGGLFKSRPLLTKQYSSSGPLIHESDMQITKLGLSIPPNYQSPVRILPAKTSQSPNKKTSKPRGDSPPKPPPKPTKSSALTVPAKVPRLDVEIPTIEMDRYSIMFRDVAGIQSSTLLARRSRQLQARLKDGKEDVPPVPGFVLRPSTAPESSSAPSNKMLPLRSFPYTSEVVSKFPQVPSSSNNSVPRPIRSMSSPARLSPVTTVRHKPNDPTRVIRRMSSDSISLGGTTTSTDRDHTPWRSVESLKSAQSSRTSLEDEIFLDIKALGSSSDGKNAHYIMTRPDPAAIKIARTLSQKRKLRSSRSMDTKKEATEGRSRMSVQLDDAIAEVERLTSPSSKNPFISISQNPGPLKSRKQLPSASKSMAKNNKTQQVFLQPYPANSKPVRRLEGLAIGIPSPITERSNEGTPRSILSYSSTDSPSRARHLAYETRLPSGSPKKQSPTEHPMIARKPLPISKKSTTFIPISKFAASDTSEKVAQRTGLHATRSTRAATDSALVTRSSLSLQHARSVTLTLPQTGIESTTTISPDKINEPYVITVTVQPKTEVSEARTVSLTRRQSHRVLIARTPSERQAEEKQRLRQSRALSPEIRQGEKGHQPGASVNLLVECA